MTTFPSTWKNAFCLAICPECKGLKDQQLSRAVDVSEDLRKMLEAQIQVLFQAERTSIHPCSSQEKTSATEREAVLKWDALSISLELHCTLCNQTLPGAGEGLGLPPSEVDAYQEDHLLKAD